MTESLSIQMVSRLSGVSDHTIRAWERRYKALTPRRTNTGRRIYALGDVERLKLLNALVQRGFSIGGIATLSRQKLEELLQQASPKHEMMSQSAQASIANSQLNAQVLEAVLNFDMEGLHEALAHARAALSARDFALGTMSPLMSEVGQLVARGKLTIAQEHAFSALVRNALGQILQSLNLRRADSERVVLTTPEGDLHEFGILLSAILCASQGMSVHYLGPNLPAHELARACRAVKARLAIVGTSPGCEAYMKQTLQSYLTELDDSLPAEVEVWVGGEHSRACESVPWKARRATATVRSLRELEELMKERHASR